ncbi:VirB8/TrbF family protein [Wolbachia endosymbiont of Frankliniella intonsa]|uniref:VirB8/TrbF family protein n=1 Tax=Wolbachia endosymbiont of Frankliniella intonsa TaxID=2902422 RepID=UPI00244E6B51|nr:VirB8/TrbF family protein [Wolbachia endosymbiont of Frankliniella intonsa]WGJ61774.1 VirB8/TrbF family protein [Wolbachia endosymbiont of Frankliniella intonsa]
MEDKLLESVKNKSYFRKAVEWYCHRYLFCVVERSWMALIALLLLVCLFLSLLNIYLLLPVKKDLNFVKYMNHTEDEFSAIHKLSFSKKEDEYISIARYLISKYIETYESSRTVEPKYQENFIKNNSVYKIYQNFQEKVNNEAVSSTRKITNINVTTLSIDRLTKNLVTFAGNATVVFTAEKNKKMKDYAVEVSFTLSNIKATLAGIVPFKFIVNSYKYR